MINIHEEICYLAAKPVIDIMIGVLSLDEMYIEPIKKLGYVYVPEYEKEIPERRYFRKLNDNGYHTHHIHLVEYDSLWWKRHIQFRDYLTAASWGLSKNMQILRRNLLKIILQTKKNLIAVLGFHHYQFRAFAWANGVYPVRPSQPLALLMAESAAWRRAWHASF